MIKQIFGLLALLTVSVFGCNEKNEEQSISLNEGLEKEIQFNLEIGTSEQPMDYQFGDIIGIRTDKDGNIYVADRSALKIKMFDRNGVFVKNIGRRGRGPAEFSNINMFEISPNDDFVIVDKGNLRFTSVSKNGEEVFSTPIEISDQWQYYPDDIAFIGDKILGLYLFSGHVSVSNIFDRTLFHESTAEFEETTSSFLPYNKLDGLNDKFAWVNFIGRSGSFTVHPNETEIIYSPFIYTGKLYHLKYSNGKWDLQEKIVVEDPSERPFVKYAKEEFEKLREEDTPGIKRIYFDASEPYMGRINSADAGTYFLNDGRLVQFISEWIDKSDSKNESSGNLGVSVLLLDQDYKLITKKLLFSIDATNRPWKPTVNWKDEENNFYVINNLGAPTVKRFSLEEILN